LTFGPSVTGLLGSSVAGSAYCAISRSSTGANSCDAAHHRLRLHDSQLPSPSLRPEPPHPDPQDPGPIAQARLWLAANEHLELVSQHQIFERKVSAGTKAINKDSRQHHEEAQHRRGSISGQRMPPCARP
jgi:hypothetical protein